MRELTSIEEKILDKALYMIGKSANHRSNAAVRTRFLFKKCSLNCILFRHRMINFMHDYSQWFSNCLAIQILYEMKSIENRCFFSYFENFSLQKHFSRRLW